VVKRIAGRYPNGAKNQAFGFIVAFILVCDDTQQVQCIRLPGDMFEDIAVAFFCLFESALLMKIDGFSQSGINVKSAFGVMSG
jgi:hypothetical protein